MTSNLRTVRDYFRYAVSRFNAAGLSFGQGATNAVDEAAFLVLEGLSLPIDQLEPFLDARLTDQERERLARLIEARVVERKPAAYLLGRAYMRGVPFSVDERVIVPRSYIGELLEGPLFSDGPDALLRPSDARRVLDLCTGSACLAILAAHAFADAKIDAVDLSEAALAVARRNVADAGLEDRIRLFAGDLFAPLPRGRYDLIISNPPYVDAEGMAALPPEFRHEPALALSGGEDGLDLVKRILAEAPRRLTPDGGLLCEIGRGQERLALAYPHLPFLWLDVQEAEGEVFWLSSADWPKTPNGERPASR